MGSNPGMVVMYIFLCNIKLIAIHEIYYKAIPKQEYMTAGSSHNEPAYVTSIGKIDIRTIKSVLILSGS